MSVPPMLKALAVLLPLICQDWNRVMQRLPLKAFAVVGFAIFMAVGLILPRILAQNNMPDADYVIEGENIADFQWSVDGSGLRVIDEVIPTEERTEFVYDLETQTTQLSSSLLSTPQLDQLGLLEDASGNTFSVVYLSPDNRWAVYGVAEQESYYLAMSDLKSGQVHIVYEARLIIIDNAFLFKVRWSDDSSAFYVYTTNGPATFWYYISDFTFSLQNTRVVALHDEKGEFHEALRGFKEILDIDMSGNFLLMEQYIRVDNKIQVNLIVVNMSDYSFDPVVVLRNIKAASYGQQDEFFYISIEGMFVYDLDEGTSHLLNADINSSWIQDVEISPDGHYIAATKGGDTDSLYIIPVMP